MIAYSFLQHHNHFVGAIPSEWGQMTKLRHVYLNHNLLQHELPTQLGRLTVLRDFYLEHNAIAGTIPSQFGSLANLGKQNSLSTSFSMFLEMRTRSLFSFASSKGKFHIFTNQVTGTMPSQICSLKDKELKELEADCRGKVECDQPECCTKCH